MKKKDYYFNGNQTDTVTFTSTGQLYKPCKHQNGWFHTFWIFIFCKRVFICTDCEQVIDVKELDKDKE